jgi:hypothetical protein
MTGPVETARPVNASFWWHRPEAWQPGDPVYDERLDDTTTNYLFVVISDHEEAEGGHCIACDGCPFPDCPEEGDHGWGWRWSPGRAITLEVSGVWPWPKDPQAAEFYGARVLPASPR